MQKETTLWLSPGMLSLFLPEWVQSICIALLADIQPRRSPHRGFCKRSEHFAAGMKQGLHRCLSSGALYAKPRLHLHFKTYRILS